MHLSVKSITYKWYVVSSISIKLLEQVLRAGFYKNHPGHGDQGWTNLSKLGPYTSIDEPLSMTMKIPASVAPVFLDEICLFSLI